MSAPCCFCGSLVAEADLSPPLGPSFVSAVRALQQPCHDFQDLLLALEVEPAKQRRICLEHIVGFEHRVGSAVTVRALLAAAEALRSAERAGELVEEDPRAGLDGPAACGQCGREVTEVEHDDNAGFCLQCAGGPS